MGMIRKLSVGVLALAIVAGLCLGLTTSPVSAKSSKMKLPVKVVVDYKDAETGKWKENYTVYYKYNKKGDLTRIDLTTPDESNWVPTKIKYQYNKKGRMIDVTRKLVQNDPGKYITKTSHYTYDKKGNIRMHEWTCDDPSYDVKQAKEKYKSKMKNGKLKRSWVVRTGWLGAKTTVTRTYNNKGLLETRTNVCKENNISDNWKYTYEYDKKGKYVKRRFSNEDDANQRRTYTYGDVKGSKSLYQMTLNIDERLLLGNTERNQM